MVVVPTRHMISLARIGFSIERYSYRLGKGNRDSVADLHAFHRSWIRHVDGFRRTIGSLQGNALMGLVDRRDYDDELRLPRSGRAGNLAGFRSP